MIVQAVPIYEVRHKPNVSDHFGNLLNPNLYLKKSDFKMCLRKEVQPKLLLDFDDKKCENLYIEAYN